MSGKDSVSQAIASVERNDYRQFTEILHKLSNPSLGSSQQLVSLIDGLSANISLLNLDLATQLADCFKLPVTWIENCHSNIPPTIITLLLELGTTFPVLLDQIIQTFSRLVYAKDFSFKPNATSSTGSSQLRLMTQLCSKFVHQLMISSTQHGLDLLVSNLKSNFPTWSRPPVQLFAGLVNLMYVCITLSQSSHPTTDVICQISGFIGKLLIDLEIQCDCSDDTVTQSYIEDQKVSDLLFAEPSNSKSLDRLHQVICQKLDSLLLAGRSRCNQFDLDNLLVVVLLFVKPLCCASSVPANNSSNVVKLDWQLLCSLFKQQRSLFDQDVLPTDTDLTLLPLLFVYTCSLKPGLVISCAEYLLQIVENEHRDGDSRLKAVAYLTYLNLRVSATPLDLIVELLHELTSWAVAYVYRNRDKQSLVTVGGRRSFGCDESLTTKHKLYYAVCESIFLTLTTLHDRLLSVNSSHRATCDRLPLVQIFHSYLKPWNQLSPNLLLSFSRVLDKHHSPAFSLFALTIGLEGGEYKSDAQSANCNLDDIEPTLFELPFSNNSSSLVKQLLHSMRYRVALNGDDKSKTNGTSRKRSRTADEENLPVTKRSNCTNEV